MPTGRAPPVTKHAATTLPAGCPGGNQLKKLLIHSALGLVGLAATTGAASAATAYTEAALNLRSGPGTWHGVIVAMPAGAPVEVIDCYGNGWCEVVWNGYRGFASEAYLDRAVYAAPAPAYRAPAYYPPGYYGYGNYRGPSIGFYYHDDDRDRRQRHGRRDHDHDRDWRDRDHNWGDRDRDHRKRYTRPRRDDDRDHRNHYTRRDHDDDRDRGNRASRPDRDGDRDGRRNASRRDRDGHDRGGARGSGRGDNTGRRDGHRGGERRGGDNRGS